MIQIARENEIEIRQHLRRGPHYIPHLGCQGPPGSFHNNLVRVEEEEKIHGSLQAKDQTFLLSTVFLHRIIMVYCVEILQR